MDCLLIIRICLFDCQFLVTNSILLDLFFSLLLNDNWSFSNIYIDLICEWFGFISINTHDFEAILAKLVVSLNLETVPASTFTGATGNLWRLQGTTRSCINNLERLLIPIAAFRDAANEWVKQYCCIRTLKILEIVIIQFLKLEWSYRARERSTYSLQSYQWGFNYFYSSVWDPANCHVKTKWIIENVRCSCQGSYPTGLWQTFCLGHCRLNVDQFRYS